MATLNMAKLKDQLKVLNDVASSEKVSVQIWNLKNISKYTLYIIFLYYLQKW